MNILNNKEISTLNNSFVEKLERSAMMDRMPTVKVRPTISIEVKQRVLNCQMKEAKLQSPKEHKVNLNSNLKKRMASPPSSVPSSNQISQVNFLKMEPPSAKKKKTPQDQEIKEISYKVLQALGKQKRAGVKGNLAKM